MRPFFLLLPALLAACQPEGTRRGEPEDVETAYEPTVGSGAWTVLEFSSDEVADNCIRNEDANGSTYEFAVDLQDATVLAVSVIGLVGSGPSAQDRNPITDWRISDGTLLIYCTGYAMRVAYLTQ